MATGKTLAVHGLAALSAAQLKPGLAAFSSGNVVDLLLLEPATGCPNMAWAETGFQSCVFGTSEPPRTESGEFTDFIFLASQNL